MTVGDCKGCGRPMVGRVRYRSRAIREAGFVQHEGHGLCRADYRRAQSAGTFPDPAPRQSGPRSYVRREDWLTDYRILSQRDPKPPLHEIARRIGMSLYALDQAVVRARRDGITI